MSGGNYGMHRRPGSSQAGARYVLPVLTVPDFDLYLQQNVLDVIGTLQEDETADAVIRHRGSRF